MSDFRRAATRRKLWMAGIIFRVLLVTVFVGQRYYMLGLLLGTIVSYVNLLVLYRRTTPMAESAGDDLKVRGFGSFIRMILSILGAYIALKNDLSLVTYIIGLFVMHPIMLLDYLFFNRPSRDERG